MQDSRNLPWLDLEMTGLDPEAHTIIEIAVAVTDSDLNLVAEGPCFAVHQPDEVLTGMDDWCREHHGKSGLIERVRRSPVSLEEAQARVLEFVAKHCPPRTAPLCGNTIGQDRRFLLKYMPRLHDYFHYRSIDVSTIKELVARWYKKPEYQFIKENRHLAMGDVQDSIAELAHYRRCVFKAD